MQLTKEKQLNKNKRPNPKKMPKLEKETYIDFLREKSGGICQIPSCHNRADDWEHPDRGINRDDRYTILICRECHMKADQPNPKQIDESSIIKLAGKKIGRQNWADYIV